MTAESGLGPAPLESARFGLRVQRATYEGQERPNLRDMLPRLVADGVDVAILRAPAPFQPLELARFGMPVLHADTLVYYECDLQRHVPRPFRNQDLDLSLATVEDRAAVEELVASTFDGYRCHYHANPLLDPRRVLDGYMEWALGFVLAPDSGRQTWVARRDGRIVAFACCNDDGRTGGGVLYGVHPAQAGGGVYSDLIRHTQRVFRDAGRATMQVSTQVWNYAVQKVWSREGFCLARAYDTWHVNTLLSAGEVLFDGPLEFTHEQVAQFAELTGDRNPLHLDTDAARAAGFESQLSHGMLTGAELSKVFGTQAPGPGTLFLRASLAFLGPVYAGRAHRLVVRALPRPDGRARLAVATVVDTAGTPCVLAYCDLLRKPT